MTFTAVSAGQLIKASITNANLRHVGRLGEDMRPQDTNGTLVTDGSLDLGDSPDPWGDVYLKTGAKIYKGGVEFNPGAGAEFRNNRYGYIPNGGADEFQVIQTSAGANQAVEIDDSGGTWYGSDESFCTKSGGNTAVALSAANGSNPRWDLISIDASAGTYTATDGTAAANPVFPSTPAGQDALAYVYRPTAVNTVYTRNIFDVRRASPVKNTDGHFKTNFSINQKEDTEDSEYETQQYFQQIPFGTTFDSIVQDKLELRTVDTFAVRADCDEITYSGSWANGDSSSYKFGRAKETTTAADTAIFSFFGVAVGVSIYQRNDSGFFTAELSSDGGSTYGNLITISPDTGSSTFNNFWDLYIGLPIGEYKVKLTNKRAAYLTIDHFYYTTHCIQKPSNIFAFKSGSGGTAATVDDLPPATSFLSGTWGTKPTTATGHWNGQYLGSASSGDYIEFRFYGSKIWICLTQTTATDSDIDFLIDGVNTYVRNTSGFNPDTPNNVHSFHYRIDNGSLPEGWHVVKVTATSITAANNFYFGGFAFYSANCPSTVCRSLILGKDSYALGADSSSFTYSGTWVGLADATGDFLRRRNSTVTNAAYVEITTPNNANLKAIYLVAAVNNSTVGAELKIQLAGAKIRYVDLQTANYFLPAFIIPIYDSFYDGDLANQALRIIHNDTTTSTQFIFGGVIFEMGNKAETTHIMAMPKWTRYNNSTNVETCVSNTYRLDVYGAKSDQSPGHRPFIHSGWCSSALNAALYSRIGIFSSQISNVTLRAQTTPIMNQGTLLDAGYAAAQTGIDNYWPGTIRKLAGSSASSFWQKFLVTLKEVV